MARFRTRLAPSTSRRQRGVYAIELAFVFMIFFGLIYALVCYGILFTFRLGLQSAAEEGARAALRVRALSTPSTTQIIQREDAAKVAANNRLDGWLPTAATRDVQACVRKTDQDDTCPAGAKITSAECGAGGTPDVAWSSRCQIVVKVRANILKLRLGVSSRIRAIRAVRTVVLPTPGPASTRDAPSPHPTASRCVGLRRSSSAASSGVIKHHLEDW